MADPEEKYVTIIAIKNNDVCVLDQIEYATAYRNVYSYNGPDDPLAGHFSRMKAQWPPNWIIISKPEWETKHGKLVYP